MHPLLLFHLSGMLLHGQKLVPTWATYQQFIMEMGWARQNDARKNKSLSQGSVDFEGQGMEVVAAAPWG